MSEKIAHAPMSKDHYPDNGRDLPDLISMYVDKFDETAKDLTNQLRDADVYVMVVPQSTLTELPAMFVRNRRLLGEHAIRAFIDERRSLMDSDTA